VTAVTVPVRARAPLHDAGSGLGWRQGTAYGALGLPLAFLALPLYVHLPNHYAVQHGLPLGLLGAVLLATRAADALLDPFIGQAVDLGFLRSPRAPWRIAAGAAVVVALAFAALFLPPDLRGAPLVAWLVAGLLLAYVGYSVLAVLHQAWGTRLGGDALQRSRIVAWREGFGVAGVLLASVLPALGGAVLSSAVLAVALVLGIGLLARAPLAAAGPTDPLAPPARWHLPWADRHFRGLLGAFMLNGIASAVPATLLLFFVQDRLQAMAALPLFLGLYFAAAVLSIPLWLAVVRRVGLVASWLAGMGLAVLAFAGALALGTGEQLGFAAVCLASGIALGADLTVPGALLAGVVQRSRHGGGAAGVYAGWWTSASKLNLGLAAGAALPLLALAGYAPGARDATSLQALSFAYVAVPCVLKLAAAAALWRWWTREPQGTR
jgi:GPH family glycoside/pentoside/hexuronide:cation symporter